jgi:hypothetical protein
LKEANIKLREDINRMKKFSRILLTSGACLRKTTVLSKIEQFFAAVGHSVILLTFIISILSLSLTACSSTDMMMMMNTPGKPASITDEQTIDAGPSDNKEAILPDMAVPQIPGFKAYESDTYGFRVQYPMEWLLTIDIFNIVIEMHGIGISQEEIINEISDKFGVDNDKAAMLYYTVPNFYFDGTVVHWYDLENTYYYMMPSIGIMIGDAEGLSQNDLRSSEYKKDHMTYSIEYFNQVFDDVKVAIDIDGKMLGNNYFLFLAIDYDTGFERMALYQTITEINGILYALNFGIAPHMLSDYLSVIEKVLSSLEVIE